MPANESHAWTHNRLIEGGIAAARIRHRRLQTLKSRWAMWKTKTPEQKRAARRFFERLHEDEA